jgi:hypothetical protein
VELPKTRPNQAAFVVYKISDVCEKTMPLFSKPSSTREKNF